MAYDFKKLKDVTTVGAVTDKANVLIEENGVIKKVNKNEIAGKKEVSWNDLTDKPFEAIVEMVEIVPMMNITPTANYEGVSSAAITGNIPRLYEGESYIVIYDGVEYHCVVRLDIQGGEASVIGFGNGTLFDSYWEAVEDVPFYFLSTYDNDPRNIIYFTEEGTHTFAIGKKEETVVPIDGKFISKESIQDIVTDIINDVIGSVENGSY